MNASGPPSPVAEGQLSSTPFGHVLLYVEERKLTGTLAVWPEVEPGEEPPRGQDWIYFQAGTPIAARLLAHATALDRGMLPLFTRRNAPYAFYDVNLIGEGDEVLRGRVDPFALFAASLRGSAREDAIDGILARLGDTPLRMRRGVALDRFSFDRSEQAFIDLLRAAPAPISELLSGSGQDRLARRLIHLLLVTHSVEAFEGSATPTGGSEHPAHLRRESTDRRSPVPRKSPEPPAPSAPAEGPGTPDVPGPGTASASGSPPTSMRPATRGTSMPPRTSAAPGARRSIAPTDPDPAPDANGDLSAELAARWHEVQERAKQIEHETYFAMLGVERAASAETVQTAYLSAAKKWHPDRLPQELEALRPWADCIFDYLTRARDTLVSEKERGPYLRQVQDGGGTPTADRKLLTIVSAAMEFQKVEVLARRREWDEALRLLEAILAVAPNDADHHAMKAWILFHQRGTDDPSTVREILAESGKALELGEKCERAHMTRGVILKRLGRNAEALEHFQQVARLNPRNIDAVREVRLSNIRGKRTREAVGAEAGSGLLSKLFGSKKKS